MRASMRGLILAVSLMVLLSVPLLLSRHTTRDGSFDKLGDLMAEIEADRHLNHDDSPKRKVDRFSADEDDAISGDMLFPEDRLRDPPARLTPGVDLSDHDDHVSQEPRLADEPVVPEEPHEPAKEEEPTEPVKLTPPFPS